MNWLFLSDLQGIEYAEWKSFMEMDESAIDVVITLGDIDIQYLQSLRNKFAKKPFYGVLGNHDAIGDLEYFGIQNLHNEVVGIHGKSIAGLEGCIRYKNERDCPLYSQEEIETICTSLPPVDILISHNSPLGIHDKKDMAHVGYEGLAKFINEKHPSHVFHGHQHKNQRTKVGKTLVTCIIGGWLWDAQSDEMTQVLKVQE